MSAVKEVQGPSITVPGLGLPVAVDRHATPDRVARLRLRMLGVAAVLGVGALLLVATGSPVGVWSAVLAIVLDTALAVALASIAAMSWVRYHEHGPVRVLYQCSAFAVLACGSLVNLAVIVALPSAVPEASSMGWRRPSG